jgi:hypothetical protein
MKELWSRTLVHGGSRPQEWVLAHTKREQFEASGLVIRIDDTTEGGIDALREFCLAPARAFVGHLSIEMVNPSDFFRVAQLMNQLYITRKFAHTNHLSLHVLHHPTLRCAHISRFMMFPILSFAPIESYIDALVGMGARGCVVPLSVLRMDAQAGHQLLCILKAHNIFVRISGLMDRNLTEAAMYEEFGTYIVDL